MSDGAAETTYDAVYYQSQPYRRTHPLHVSTVAALFGLTPRNPASASVLELGCGDGSNLIPMAATFPEARFLGIDLSSRRVADGRRTIEALGLSNIELRCGDILDPGLVAGTFDYTIAHGLLSWVPRAVQERIFALCEESLSENGLAYLSYNTFPGWGVRSAFREAALFSGEGAPDTPAKLRAAREMLGLLAHSVRSEDGYDVAFLKSELNTLAGLPEWYLFHDLLSECNEPFYFRSVAERAGRFGLQFVAEADLSKCLPQELSREAQLSLRSSGGDRIALEQLMDFFRMRMFRCSIFCRSSRRVAPSPYPHPLLGSSFAARLGHEEDFEAIIDGTPVRFSHPSGGAIATGDPLLKSASHHLASRWPRWVRYDDLCSVLAAPPYLQDPAGFGRLAPHLLRCVLANVVELSFYDPPEVVTEPGPNPIVFAPARHRARFRDDLPTLRHETAHLPPLPRRLAPLLDGSRDLMRAAAELGEEIGGVEEAVRLLAAEALLLRQGE